MDDRSLPIGREARKRRQGENIDALSQEFDLDEKQLNLLRSSGLWSYGDLTKYVNELLLKQYSTEDERDYNEGLRDEQREWDLGEISRMRSLGLNPDLQGVPESGSPIQGSGSIYPDNPLSKALSGGSLSQSFDSVLGTVLKLATFGVQSYGTVTSALMESGLKVAGLALSDLPSFDRDEKGVADVESAIASGIASRGFRPGSRKASIYASTVRQHINSLPQILKYAQDKDLYNKAIASGKVSAFEASDEYAAKITRGLDLAADAKIQLEEIDLKIAKDKAEFLAKHPDYTAEQLEAELTMKTEGARKATADADKAEADAAGTRLDNARKSTENKLAEEDLKQETAQTAATESDKDLKLLKNSIEQHRIDGFDVMIEFCRQYEEESFQAHRKSGYGMWERKNIKRTELYHHYKNTLRKAGFYKNKRLSLKGSVGAGPVSLGLGN